MPFRQQKRKKLQVVAFRHQKTVPDTPLKILWTNLAAMPIPTPIQ